MSSNWIQYQLYKYNTVHWNRCHCASLIYLHFIGQWIRKLIGQYNIKNVSLSWISRMQLGLPSHYPDTVHAVVLPPLSDVKPDRRRKIFYAQLFLFSYICSGQVSTFALFSVGRSEKSNNELCLENHARPRSFSSFIISAILSLVPQAKQKFPRFTFSQPSQLCLLKLIKWKISNSRDGDEYHIKDSRENGMDEKGKTFLFWRRPRVTWISQLSSFTRDINNSWVILAFSKKLFF